MIQKLLDIPEALTGGIASRARGKHSPPVRSRVSNRKVQYKASQLNAYGFGIDGEEVWQGHSGEKRLGKIPYPDRLWELSDNSSSVMIGLFDTGRRVLRCIDKRPTPCCSSVLSLWP